VALEGAANAPPNQGGEVHMFAIMIKINNDWITGCDTLETKRISHNASAAVALRSRCEGIPLNYPNSNNSFKTDKLHFVILTKFTLQISRYLNERLYPLFFFFLLGL